MVDPLADVISLLQPGAPFSKLVAASAPWAVQRAETGRPFYFAVLEGSCYLTIENDDHRETLLLSEGDFVLIPEAKRFSTSSLDRQPPVTGETITTPITPMPGGARVGNPDSVVDMRMLVGNCVFGSPDSALLVSLLPQWLHVRGEKRLSTLVQMVGEEYRADKPAREMVMTRLLEVLLIEAFRSAAVTAASPGLVRGLSDPKLAITLRCMHGSPAAGWTIAQLARAAAMSRSGWCERFNRAVGMPPMAYLMALRMAIAKRLLREGELPLADIAERTGYRSVSAFGVAFTRYTGMPPGRFAKKAFLLT
ncbi:AraC family transcriptional regulator [Rahnella sp. C60]|uniref:AraC family transcriptional regulator n=1 Tax=Rahnella perminowiae TaxID=2816244 RepID=A0ABS6KXY4_9GAMM|nr:MULTISPECIES: AraC family transcriptional regulator [Rahnella]UJD88228.1 AraC family transcriptional regulator [Rahnella aquatilis]MBU9812745.1 AraC family transcriptional regulator [Rahnella perminowiae]MBU9816332.1 AraC family transcriptional regulator [Rahnella perminowiae]MBU9826506.1 AraC family transcriptional regulator [Rahnella perminowiae]MBU9834459.1 AraC family transcriptional regulator [Rahnella perminowiae]